MAIHMLSCIRYISMWHYKVLMLLMYRI